MGAGGPGQTMMMQNNLQQLQQRAGSQPGGMGAPGGMMGGGSPSGMMGAPGGMMGGSPGGGIGAPGGMMGGSPSGMMGGGTGGSNSFASARSGSSGFGGSMSSTLYSQQMSPTSGMSLIRQSPLR